MKQQPISHMQALRFRQLAWPMLPVVLRTAQLLVGQSGHAEDLAQETMLKAMMAIDSFKEDSNIKAWLLTILRRTHIDQIRTSQHRPLQLSLDVEGIDLPAPPQPAASVVVNFWSEPDKLLERLEDQDLITALLTLSEETRWTLLLVDVEQMNHVDAAEILGVAVGTVKSRAHRGRALLREQLHELAARRGWVRAREKTS